MFSHTFPVPLDPLFLEQVFREMSALTITLAILTTLQANATDCGETESKDLSSTV